MWRRRLRLQSHAGADANDVRGVRVNWPVAAEGTRWGIYELK